MTLKVRLDGPARLPDIYATSWITIPGIGTGVLYTTGDALGTKFTFLAPRSGTVRTVEVWDQDEQLGFDILLFDGDFTATADNAAFALADAEFVKFLGALRVEAADYLAFSNNAAAVVRNLGFAYVLPGVEPMGTMHCQLVTRGAANYGAATDLNIRLQIEPRR